MAWAPDWEEDSLLFPQGLGDWKGGRAREVGSSEATALHTGGDPEVDRGSPSLGPGPTCHSGLV